MTNGNLNKFLLKHPSHDRVSVLYQVTKGLQYLHSIYVYHGDVKAANILVDENCCCYLADFGITALISTQTVTAALASATLGKGTFRWMAPEVLIPNPGEISGSRTAPRDIYALACTAIEVATGKLPFPDLNEASAMLAVIRGERPARPHLVKWMTNDLWNLIERCWAQNPNNRPSSNEVVLDLERVLLSRRSNA
ncbi:kinase-like domain-containing protein [Flagelloscypha sp. PMI_526]|nr:kinase-like domain-containing protein [Flagelloscypha sp. PMI_526]